MTSRITAFFSLGVALSTLLFAVSCAKTEAVVAKADGELDRTVLPIHEPKPSTITTLDARDAKAPPRFEVKAPEERPTS